MTSVPPGGGFVSNLRCDHPGLAQEAILDEMRQALLGGEVPPGTPIPVDETAQVFGVSRIPVREALKVLMGEGLVVHERRAGYAVASVTLAEFKELYFIRSALEIAAARAAAGSATEDDHREAVMAMKALDRASAAGDEPSFHHESREFHLAIIRASRMPRVVHMIELAWNITEPVQLMRHVERSSRESLHSQHADMLHAFLARDTAALVRTTQRHLHAIESAVAELAPPDGLFAD